MTSMQNGPSKCSASGKTRFSTPGDAKEALQRIKSKQSLYDPTTKKRIKRRNGKAAQCRYYYCKHCRGFHLTSSGAAVKQKTIEKNFMQRIRNTEGLVLSETEAAEWKKDSLPFPNS